MDQRKCTVCQRGYSDQDQRKMYRLSERVLNEFVLHYMRGRRTDLTDGFVAKLDEASLVNLNTQVIVRVGWDLLEGFTP